MGEGGLGTKWVGGHTKLPAGALSGGERWPTVVMQKGNFTQPTLGLRSPCDKTLSNRSQSIIRLKQRQGDFIEGSEGRLVQEVVKRMEGGGVRTATDQKESGLNLLTVPGRLAGQI